MAENIKLVTYSGSTVTPLDDALVYEKAVGQSGIIYGAEITLKNTNTLHINAGHGVICGRKFTIVDSDIPVQLTAGTTSPGRVYIHLDLSNTTEPLQILTEIAGTLTAPIQQENVNINNGVYEFDMATFTIDAQTISDVVNVFIPIENTTGNLNDLTTEDKSSLVAAVNEINKKEVSVLDTGEEIMANTASNKAAGAKGVKELFTEVTNSLGGVSQLIVDETTGKITGYKTEIGGADTVFPFSSGVYGTFTPTDKTIIYNIDLGFRPKVLMIMNAKNGWCCAYYLNEETNEIHTQAGGYGDNYTWMETVVTITDTGFLFNLSAGHQQPTNQLNKTHYYIAL